MISSAIVAPVSSQRGQYKSHKNKRSSATISRSGKSVMIGNVRVRLDGTPPTTPRDRYIPNIPTSNRFSALWWFRGKHEDSMVKADVKQKTRRFTKLRQIWVPKKRVQKFRKDQADASKICSLKQEQSVRRLKTFVVTYQRKERKKDARKAAKPILFYKGELILQTYTGDDFGWEDRPNNQLESIQEMADMPEKIKEMCRKQKIPQGSEFVGGCHRGDASVPGQYRLASIEPDADVSDKYGFTGVGDDRAGLAAPASLALSLFSRDCDTRDGIYREDSALTWAGFGAPGCSGFGCRLWSSLDGGDHP
ncbi:hypothetical protein Taro_038370 [Colocasia esculenta]|uniref:Uncharacterized protein n=1 Tax=Colocasia esculenta TaxID=4460 RepID=A0A843W3B2_COLES|nr:hypothetical protein [Colocasia esculenta]